ncbi:hypothetical protein CDD82_6332 [Ophiocordyceps australis]|uniref:Uncharacterized protein n=1 Tax=Ophiocordyceps australis TaxID=1399860 RepID=A0A2C5YQL3_9HYPO|nr:hypothetical protein CDD82_6332 [Ophiocordyceps australis]
MLRRVGKVILCCILGLGVFNILAAILNRYYNFSTPNSYVFLYWYVAEVGISMMVGNLPLCWPILRFMLGSRAMAKTPSYHGDTISGSSRKKQRIIKNPLSTMGTLGSRWDKLDEAEHDAGGIGGGAPRERLDSLGEEQGSQIELVLQQRQKDETTDDKAMVVTVAAPEEQSSGGSVHESSDGRPRLVKEHGGREPRRRMR